MTDSPARIAADIPTLRNVAAQLASAAEEAAGLQPHIKELRAAVRREAAANTADGNAAPIFSPLLQALDTVIEKVDGNFDQLHKNLAGDAESLKKQADDLERTDHGHGQQIAGMTTASAKL
jgi:hypothetical protein